MKSNEVTKQMNVVAVWKCTTTYGAPMGRNGWDERPTDHKAKVYKRRIYTSQGYDKGGAYWGHNDLYVEFTLDGLYVRYYSKH